MGMDIYGINPTTETGMHFGITSWGWVPLADYIIKKAPAHLVSKATYWYTNDGDGRDADDAAELAKWLRGELESGAVKYYEQGRNHYLATLPKVKCRSCKVRADAESGYPDKIVDRDGPRKGPNFCNACNGWGGHENSEVSYTFSEQIAADFLTFLEDSGGFQIW